MTTTSTRQDTPDEIVAMFLRELTIIEANVTEARRFIRAAAKDMDNLEHLIASMQGDADLGTPIGGGVTEVAGFKPIGEAYDALSTMADSFPDIPTLAIEVAEFIRGSVDRRRRGGGTVHNTKARSLTKGQIVTAP